MSPGAERVVAEVPPIAAPAHAGRAGLALLASITLLWGFNWPVLKIAVGEMPVFTFRSISLLIGVVGMFIVWSFLVGFPFAFPFTVLAAYAGNRAGRATVWTCLAFTAFFWSAQGLLLWKSWAT